MHTESTSAWALWGKIVTALSIGAGLAVSLIGIYSYITTARSELRATIEVNRFAMPPSVLAAATRDHQEYAQAFLDKDRREAAAEGTAPDSSAATAGNGAARLQVEKLGTEFDRFTASVPPPPASVRQYVHIEVENAGSLVAKEVSVALPPWFHVVTVTREDGSAQSVAAPKRIGLGNLNPRERVTVEAWTVVPIDLLGPSLEDEVVLSYEGGMGAVELAERRFIDPARRFEVISYAFLGALGGLLAYLITRLASRRRIAH